MPTRLSQTHWVLEQLAKIPAMISARPATAPLHWKHQPLVRSSEVPLS